MCLYWVPQQLPQIYTVIAYICTGRLRELQYRFAIIYETRIIYHVYFNSLEVTNI